MKIIYVGPLWYGGTCLQRMEAMKDLGHSVIPVDTAPDDVREREKKIITRLIRKIFGPQDLARVNPKILDVIRETPADVVWLDRSVTVKAATLEDVRRVSPKTVIAGYSPDDIGVRHNQSRELLRGISRYHIYFTTKSYNVKEIQEMGCSRVEFIGKGYDPRIHQPRELTSEESAQFGGTVGFIGDYERQRVETMNYLADHGVPVRIWGPHWKGRPQTGHPGVKIEGKPLWAEDYAKAICSFDINLGFLRKANRDLQTARSIEIPACGGFMLAERTDEHLELFVEGREAEFFGSREELLAKIKYYLTHETERRRIARAGRERCLRSGYSNHDRMKQMLSRLEVFRST